MFYLGHSACLFQMVRQQTRQSANSSCFRAVQRRGSREEKNTVLTGILAA